LALPVLSGIDNGTAVDAMPGGNCAGSDRLRLRPCESEEKKKPNDEHDHERAAERE